MVGLRLQNARHHLLTFTLKLRKQTHLESWRYLMKKYGKSKPFKEENIIYCTISYSDKIVPVELIHNMRAWVGSQKSPRQLHHAIVHPPISQAHHSSHQTYSWRWRKGRSQNMDRWRRFDEQKYPVIDVT